MNRRHILHVAVIWAFAVIAYLPSFDVGFVFDDVPNLVNNPTVQPDSLSELAEMRVTRGQDDYVGERPVAMYSFALNHLLTGLDPFSYHLLNLIIHACNAAVLYALLVLLWRARQRSSDDDRSIALLALFGALLWAVHPVNTQAVTYIVQRMTSLCALFYLLGMLVFTAWRLGRLDPRVALPLLIALFVLGMGTKPIMITFPAALLLLDLFLTGRWRRAHLVAVAGVLAIAAFTVLGWGSTWLAQFTETYPRRDFSGLERVLTQGRVLLHYLGLWFWPDPGRLQLDYAIEVSRGWLQPVTTLVAWAAIAAVTAIAAATARRAPWPALAWFFFLLASSVEASFLNLELVFEHRMYLPSVFLFAAVLALIPRRTGYGAALTLPMLLLAGGLAWATIERNRDWATTEGLWMEELQRGASIGRAGLNAAVRHAIAGHPRRAIGVIERTLPHAEGIQRLQLLQQRGEAELALGRIDAAADTLASIHKVAHNWSRNRYFLGRVELERGDVKAASEIAQNLRESQPDSSFGLALEALVLQHEGKADQAVALLQAHLEEAGSRIRGSLESFIRLHLASAYRELGQSEAAYEQYRIIVGRDPHNWAAWAQIYHMLVAGNDLEQAERVKRYLDERGVDVSAWRPGE